MKQFIIRISVFCAILLLLGYAFDYWLSMRLMHRNHIEFSSWKDIVEGRNDIDIAFIGSSRTYYGINPLVIDSVSGIKAYNFGIEGFVYNQQYDRYCMIRAKDMHPKYIVQSIDYTATLKWDLFKDEQFLPFFWDKDMRNIVLRKRYNIFELYIPLLRYYGQRELIVGSLFGYESNYHHTLGWGGGNNSVWNPKDFHNLESITFNPDQRAMRLFADFLNDIDTSGIQLVLVYDPIYIGKTRNVTNLERVYQVYDSLIGGRNIPVLDYTFSYISLDTNFFSDTEHLNTKGANEYSKVLARDLDSLIRARE